MRWCKVLKPATTARGCSKYREKGDASDCWKGTSEGESASPPRSAASTASALPDIAECLRGRPDDMSWPDDSSPDTTEGRASNSMQEKLTISYVDNGWDDDISRTVSLCFVLTEGKSLE